MDNKVINLKSFARYHPGGRYVIENTFGTDVGRYFYGVYGFSKYIKSHVHSLYNWKLMNKRVVGMFT